MNGVLGPGPIRPRSSSSKDSSRLLKVPINGEQVCNKQWDLEERRRSYIWRELSAILFALHSFLPLLIGSYVKWFSDSQSACKIIQVGSMRSDLHACPGDFSVLCQ